jgi:hypothetical protein
MSHGFGFLIFIQEQNKIMMFFSFSMKHSERMRFYLSKADEAGTIVTSLCECLSKKQFSAVAWVSFLF